jgi:hypothetical protein
MTLDPGTRAPSARGDVDWLHASVDTPATGVDAVESTTGRTRSDPALDVRTATAAEGLPRGRIRADGVGCLRIDLRPAEGVGVPVDRRAEVRGRCPRLDPMGR